jgi:general nucleoside transport system permease protein
MSAIAAVAPLDLGRRNRRFGVFSLVLAAVAGGVFTRTGAGLDATFRLSSHLAGGAGSRIGDLVIPVGPVTVVLALAIGAIGVVQLTRGFDERTTTRVVGAVLGLFVFAFLVWAARDASLAFVDLLRGSLRAAVPLIFGALAGVLCERAGVINIAIEGQLLAGAFTAAVVASVADSAVVGAIGGLAAGALVAGLLALLAIRYRTDQIVAGVVLIVLVTGLTNFLTSQVLATSSGFNTPTKFRAIEIPLLADIPILGPVLFDHTLLVYVAVASVVVLQYALYHTRWGLRLRSVGEHPKAADTVGIRVLATRYRAVLLGGAIAGLGGVYLSIDVASQFSRQMTGGKGFIALAAMLAGRYNPRGALGAALVFGFADALATSLQILSVGVPSSLLRTAPFVATIFVVAGLVGRLRMPAADGKPYVKE